MKAAIWKAAGAMEIGSLPKPSIDDHEVLIKVKAAGICGTDLTIYQGKFPRERATPPMVLGHEFSGEIVEIGKSVIDYEVGDRVTADPLTSCGDCYACNNGIQHACSSLKLIGIDKNGAFAEFVKVSTDKVYRLPEALSFEEGAVIEPLAVAVHALQRARLGNDDKILIIGGGPIGILVALVAKVTGIKKILVSEIQDHRIDIIRKIGFDYIDASAYDIRDTFTDYFQAVGPDIVFEATGTARGFQQAIDITRIRGTILEVSVPKIPVELDLKRVNFAELSIVGSRVYTPDDIESAIELLPDIVDRIKNLTHVFPIEDCPDLFKKLSTGEGNLVKVILSF
ncbi:MAG: alcohol dehydrogenase catalytic domain-containing protein [Spirochaetota bacterium]|nr:MAG: alcohol dehydrogenase catalytic domain-containing protein [Spirochaetota bacterium]